MSKIDTKERLDMARCLVAHLEAGEDDQAELIIHDLAGHQEHALFQEVGRLTRELHEAINGFLIDERISELAEYEIPDASERLNYVITMTDKAAHRTLNAVEESLPLVAALERSGKELSGEWDRFRARMLSIDEFEDLSRAITAFLDLTKTGSEGLQKKLSEVLMAQDYQDITGQIIRNVIDLVKDVEEKLIQLVRISGNKLPNRKEKQRATNTLEGPVVPGIDQGDVMHGQDDVDDLLSSLGF